MNSTENTPENTPADRSRPFGFWITAVDRLLAAEFATAFEDEGITRRDWRILNAVDGTVPLGRDLPDGKVRHLAALGWVEPGPDGWTLTAEGAAAKARLSTAVEEIRAQVAGALDPEEFATMAAALEKLARGLGYEEGTRLPRRHTGERRGAGRDRREHGHRGRGHRGHDRHHGDHHDGEFGERFARHGEHPRHEDGFHGGHPGGFGHGRFGGRSGAGREWSHREHLRHEHLRHEHRCGGHADGERLPREHGRGEHPFRGHGAPGRSPAHLHIHLHDGRHRNG
ncbi:MarR family winged helix-turn-helix transcriptional regulator [Microbacterium azadirachtae]|uniref:DNA-binding transcriptional regulator, MarR family n=1 Tax=Microbacterium azadirachtae TaxID=582680 RepID=A0A0F0LN07_9MICO|nr:hypothetical protein [Microbacterium azadirachtae]KJL34528.1 hypothetical protein RS86_00783 [Microbacterium azadirachtae]